MLKKNIELYNYLYSWLTESTPGNRRNLSTYKYYQENLWSYLLEMINTLSNKEELTKEEQDFMDLVVYKGDVYRVQNYRSRRRGHIYETNYFQSWSKSIEAVSEVTNYMGDILLIIGQADVGIDIVGLLTFMLSYGYANTFNPSMHINNLDRYIKENEIVVPMIFENIKDIIIINHDSLNDWKTKGTKLERSKWKRNTL
ncbi:MAG: hypothetical protein ACRC1T_05285 [Clostridium chrysemydis]|uniref:hypothetical protein n=1 Tax=Clostridium chrysemydis TaxID=2665504 RepID=UPI003F2FF4CC